MEFCTCEDSTAVLACAKFHCDACHVEKVCLIWISIMDVSNYLHHFSVEEWYKMQIKIYFPKEVFLISLSKKG